MHAVFDLKPVLFILKIAFLSQQGDISVPYETE